MRYRPKIGGDFALSKEVILAKTQHLTEFTRSTIALSIVVAAILVLLITAAFCAYRGDYQSLQTLWAVIAAPLGCIIGYYFRGVNANGQKDNTSAA
jgi:di/tricarboxylate transporter